MTLIFFTCVVLPFIDDPAGYICSVWFYLSSLTLLVLSVWFYLSSMTLLVLSVWFYLSSMILLVLSAWIYLGIRVLDGSVQFKLCFYELLFERLTSRLLFARRMFPRVQGYRRRDLDKSKTKLFSGENHELCN